MSYLIQPRTFLVRRGLVFRFFLGPARHSASNLEGLRMGAALYGLSSSLKLRRTCPSRDIYRGCSA